MKFWVKASTDDNVQEQLLVNAANSAELVAELGTLLHTHVVRTSITDFQTQVVEKIGSGADIIPVKVVTQKKVACMAPATTGTATNSSLAASWTDADATPAHSRLAQLTQSTQDLSHVSCRGDDDDDARWPSLRGMSVTDTALPITPPSRSLFEKPKIERICLARKDVELLLHPAHDGAYHRVVCGSFVRIRENNEYALYQILRPVGSDALVLDIIHYEATRGTEIVSNAVPTAQEVQAWSRKMVAASRDFMTSGFIEAKAGDINSSRSAAEAQAESLVNAQATSCVQSLSFSGIPPEPHSLLSPSEGKRHSQQQWRYLRASAANPVAFNMLAQSFSSLTAIPNDSISLSTGSTRVQLKTNDVLLHTQIVLVEDPESGECELALFASRRSNSGKKRPRLSDFAGCIIKISKNSGILSDRDVTEKGYEMFSSPQRWDCHYVALGQIRPSVGDQPYTDSKQSFVQDFTVLSGRFLTGLFNPPTITTLPIPEWAQLEGTSAQVVRPQLIVHNDKIHVFYLIQLSHTQEHPPSQIALQSRRSSCTHRSCNGEPLEPNESVLSASGDPSVIHPSDEANVPPSVTPRPAVEPLTASSFDSPSPGAFAFGLAHAVSTDARLHIWRELTSKEPLRRSAHAAAPVFTAASVPAPDGGAGGRALQFLWHEAEHRSGSNSSGGGGKEKEKEKEKGGGPPPRPSPPRRCTALPFERWVSTHPDGAPGHWVRRPVFAASRAEAEAVRTGLASLSLYEHGNVMYTAAVQTDAHQRLTVTIIPVTTEP